MSDLVERLRELHQEMRISIGNIGEQAADEIERLRADVAEWKQAASVEAGLRREFHEQLVNARVAFARIDAINDNPARYDKEIDDLCRPFLIDKK